jgi:hypothetical protein
MQVGAMIVFANSFLIHLEYLPSQWGKRVSDNSGIRADHDARDMIYSGLNLGSDCLFPDPNPHFQ